MGLAGRGRAQDAAANAVGAERGILTSVSGHTLCLPVPTVSHGRCPVAPCGAGHACPQPSDVREWRGPALLQPPSVPKGAPPELGAQGTWATSRVQEAGAWNCVAPGSLTHPDPFKMPATSSAPPHFLSPLLPKSDIGREHCRFPSLSLCHMTNISVFLPNDPGATATWILFPESDPNRPAAATDLHCWLHHVDHVSCRWGRGPGAPSDVQYRMFWRDARQGRDRDRECPRYDVMGMGGARLGCTLDAVLPTLMMVTVTGSSGQGPVSCSDTAVDLQAAEVLTPPTLRAKCNGSDTALVSWVMRSRFHRGFEFQLEIRKGPHSELETEHTSESHFRVRIPGSASFRVRAKPSDIADFSAWSQVAELDCGPGGRSQVTVTTVATLVAVGAGLTALVTLLLLCRRRLLPPIPNLKDPMGEKAEPAELVAWEAALPEECEVTQVMEA
ncbi:interleukin-3 receptor subunit alpha-like isoform X3 [Mesocricetus auratus]|uniref:Interleukin-3 receptor subunit alpha-like isoform X3 n=2 Tax=Mesocricetus auratus TaxID=10036 RepID=A0ABM2X2M2_MESAU|nr:interleukin-3 receptor subunit alpha-like isoform X3 [Mesocricetus auratus]